MEDWRKILSRFGPRTDGDHRFYPDDLEPESPVLLNEGGVLAAALVGARLLRAVAARRGSRVGPGTAERLEKLICRGLSQEVIHHCEAEAERILHWFDDPPEVAEDGGVPPSRTPELDVMMKADLESRLSVANFALDEGYDLELEYFDEESGTWPRIRAALLEIEDAEAADFHTALALRVDGRDLSVPLKAVRWLMPVAAQPPGEEEDPGGGDLLEFPGLSDD